jgi:hypothetical protein
MVVANPAGAQTFRSELDENAPKLDSGQVFHTYELRCDGGEALRISLTSDDFDEYLLISLPDGEMLRSLPSRLLPEEGTFIDLIAEYPGEYTLYVTSRTPGDTGAYELNIQPLTQGRWLTTYQENTNIINGQSQFNLITLDFTGRILASCITHRPTISLDLKNARGEVSASQPFGNAGSAMITARIPGAARPVATARFGPNAAGSVQWALQNYQTQQHIEKQRRIAPPIQFDAQFPEQGPQEIAYTIDLQAGQYFFGYVAQAGQFNPDQPAAPDQRVTPLDYAVTITGPEGVHIEDEPSPFSVEMHAPVQGTYTVTIKAAQRRLPPGFRFAYQQSRPVPALDAPLAWSTLYTRMILQGTLDDTCETIADRRYQAYNIPLKAGDRLVVDAWSEDFKPSIILATPNQRGLKNEGVNGSAIHAHSAFVAEEDGHCTLFVIGRTPDQRGSFQLSVAVLPADVGKRLIPPDPLAREDDTQTGSSIHLQQAGRLSPQSPVREGRYEDTVTFDADDNQKFVINVVGEGFEPELIVTNAQGREFNAWTDPETKTALAMLPEGVAGPLTLRIRGSKPGEAGGYTLTIHAQQAE